MAILFGVKIFVSSQYTCSKGTKGFAKMQNIRFNLKIKDSLIDILKYKYTIKFSAFEFNNWIVCGG